MESVVPEVLRVLPRADDTVLERVRALQVVTKLACFVAAHDVLQHHISNLFLRTKDGTTNHRREDGSGEVGASKTALHELQVSGAQPQHTQEVRKQHTNTTCIHGVSAGAQDAKRIHPHPQHPSIHPQANHSPPCRYRTQRRSLTASCDVRQKDCKQAQTKPQ